MSSTSHSLGVRQVTSKAHDNNKNVGGWDTESETLDLKAEVVRKDSSRVVIDWIICLSDSHRNGSIWTQFLNR